jgi:propionyl-CoA carboxylase alpha chain
MLTKVLVANRGEIARRIFRSCHDLGISTVAVYSDADRDAPHARDADVAVRLPGDRPAETYLRGDLIIAAARKSGADAIHPGYGFLSENADFAQSVLDAGLRWIGPPPAAIASMGSKIESKRLMTEAGVPTLSEVDPEQATDADFPLLVKASSGGGGRGMRIVRGARDVAEQVEAARAEAASAFGDDTVFCEPYLETGRHIEVQVLADSHGEVWTVGERECSIQRRHQKVLEEAPSVLVERTPGMREALYTAAANAAKAIDYVGAGTVEFLADETGRFYFLEMNTRLQVEHPVTECVTGLDLVNHQLRIAEGERLGGECPVMTGHSIEARLYAEDPAAQWAPQSGTLHEFEFPGADTEFNIPPSPGVRVDAGFGSGSVIGVHYDPMLAKVIARAPTRNEAARRLAATLRAARIHGVRTNRDLLVNVLRHKEFLAGNTDTAFFDTHGLDALSAPLLDEDAITLTTLAAALADAARNRANAAVQSSLPSGWRNLASQSQSKRYEVGGTAGDAREVRYRHTGKSLVVEGIEDVLLVSATSSRVVLERDGLTTAFEIRRHGTLTAVDSTLGSLTLRALPRFADPADAVQPGSLLAETPGTVIRLAVSTSDSVRAGEPLLWLEAMKMQHQISAPCDGVVAELNVAEGDQVEMGTVLAVVSEEENT